MEIALETPSQKLALQNMSLTTIQLAGRDTLCEMWENLVTAQGSPL